VLFDHRCKIQLIVNVCHPYSRTCSINKTGEDLKNVKKDKAIPLQAWAGPEGSRRLRLTDVKTVST
jgi:hypothetical protein